jgi:hypothetical protein
MSAKDWGFIISKADGWLSLIKMTRILDIFCWICFHPNPKKVEISINMGIFEGNCIDMIYKLTLDIDQQGMGIFDVFFYVSI